MYKLVSGEARGHSFYLTVTQTTASLVILNSYLFDLCVLSSKQNYHSHYEEYRLGINIIY